MSEWINVKDRLPRDGEWVRVWSPDDEGECLGRICGDGMQSWLVVPRRSLSFKSNKAVTHWQSFGNPPKPEGPFYVSGIHEEMICYRPGDGTCSDWSLPGECKETIECLANWLNDIIQRKYKKVNDPEPPKPEGPFNFTDDAIEYTENGKVVAVLNVLAPAGWAMKDIIEWVNEVLVTTN